MNHNEEIMIFSQATSGLIEILTQGLQQSIITPITWRLVDKKNKSLATNMNMSVNVTLSHY